MNEEILARFERRSREKREQNFRVHEQTLVNWYAWTSYTRNEESP